MEQFHVNTKFLNSLPLVWRGDPIACLKKAMAFLTTVASLRFSSTNNQLRTSSNTRKQATIQDGRVIMQQVQGRQGQIYSGNGYKNNATSSRGNNASGQTRVAKCYNCQAILVANISNYGSDVISEVPHSETYLNDMENQSVNAMHDFEQTHVVDFPDNKIHSDSNIISYLYFQETQQTNVQDTNLQKKANKEQNNESLSAELERYKE
nr:hypothetical protein [Tanacetum cinerariifolium]